MQPTSSIIFDFDSTIVSIETLDELIAQAIAGKPDSHQVMTEIRSITDRGMNGEIDLSESLTLRLQAAKLHQSDIDTFKEGITSFITPGMSQLIAELKKANVTVIIVSGGLKEVILPVASVLQIPDDHVFANAVLLNDEGYVADVDRKNPLSRSSGKTELVHQLKADGVLAGSVTIVGDGSSDLHPYIEGVVDDFIGFGVHQDRPNVRQKAPKFVESVEELSEILLALQPSH